MCRHPAPTSSPDGPSGISRRFPPTEPSGGRASFFAFSAPVFPPPSHSILSFLHCIDRIYRKRNPEPEALRLTAPSKSTRARICHIPPQITCLAMRTKISVLPDSLFEYRVIANLRTMFLGSICPPNHTKEINLTLRFNLTLRGVTLSGHNYRPLPVGVVNTRSHMGARRQRLTPSGVVIQSVKDAGRRRRRAGRGVVTTSQQESVQATRLPPPKSTLTYRYWGAVLRLEIDLT